MTYTSVHKNAWQKRWRKDWERENALNVHFLKNILWKLGRVFVSGVLKMHAQRKTIETG